MTIPHTENDTVLHRQTLSEISTQQALDELAAIRERRLKAVVAYEERRRAVIDAENDKKKERLLKILERVKKKLDKMDEVLSELERNLITVQVLEMELSHGNK